MLWRKFFWFFSFFFPFRLFLPTNMAKKSGVSGKILSVFGEEKINIKLIDQGREEINIIVGISNADYDKSLKALYTRFSGEII